MPGITLIAEGSTQHQRALKHWGISLLIEDDILFDTFGHEDLFINGLDICEVDIAKLRHVIISHEHWDHIAGLWYLLEKNRNIQVYVPKHCSAEFKKRIKSYGVVLSEVSSVIKIKRDIFTSGELKGFCGDNIVYEHGLIIKSRPGLIVITGCAHPGIIKILTDIKNKFDESIYLLIGGFHLKDKNDLEIIDIVDGFKKIGVNKIVPLHCTGGSAVKIIKDQFRENCITLKKYSSLQI